MGRETTSAFSKQQAHSVCRSPSPSALPSSLTAGIPSGSIGPTASRASIGRTFSAKRASSPASRNAANAESMYFGTRTNLPRSPTHGTTANVLHPSPHQSRLPSEMKPLVMSQNGVGSKIPPMSRSNCPRSSSKSFHSDGVSAAATSEPPEPAAALAISAKSSLARWSPWACHCSSKIHARSLAAMSAGSGVPTRSKDLMYWSTSSGHLSGEVCCIICRAHFETIEAMAASRISSGNVKSGKASGDAPAVAASLSALASAVARVTPAAAQETKSVASASASAPARVSAAPASAIS
jgi:hypothetical protein